MGKERERGNGKVTSRNNKELNSKSSQPRDETKDHNWRLRKGKGFGGVHVHLNRFVMFMANNLDRLGAEWRSSQLTYI